jgi:hypothetical protein
MQGFFLGFTWIHLDFLGMNSRAGCIRAGSWEPRQVSDPGDEAVYPQRQITQALAGRMVDRIGERR